MNIMIQEHKDILLKDLCARLPYYVKAEYHTTEGTEIGIIDGVYRHDLTVVINDNEICIFDIKPYLFPMSSMTEEQKIIYGELCYTVIHSLAWDKQALNELVDWLDKNKFDHRGLIDKGLAIDATNKDIYFNI